MMELSEALQKVTDFVHVRLTSGNPGTTVKIYSYNDLDKNKIERPLAGLMVAEVSIWHKNAGASYMQVDVPWGIAVCGQVERCILAYSEEWEEEEIQEELDRLVRCLK